MIRVRVAGASILAVLIWGVLCVPAQVVIYENSAQFSGYTGHSANEYGDELMLAGSARVVTKIQFEYYGDFFANFDEKAKVRLYANDGPRWMGRSDYPRPGGAPLWESEYFVLSPGFHTQEIPVPSIKAPSPFTWTVQFYGVSMGTGITTLDPNITNDVVGLLFYGPATIGQSFDDFWERLTGDWTPVIVSGPPKNNFAVAVTAVPEVVFPRVSLERYGKYVRARWPGALTNYILEYRTLESDWFRTAAAVKVGDNWERVFDPTLKAAFFRLKDISTARGSVALTTEADGNFVHVRWPSAAAGLVLQSENSPGSGVWVDRPTPAVPIGDYFEATLALKSPPETFRLREASVSARLETTTDNQNLRIRWPLAARGQVLQSKVTDGSGSWRDVTNAAITETSSYIEAVVTMDSQSRVFRLRQ